MKYDCIVIGFGTAGSVAAVTAAKAGLKVLTIERTSCAGGTHTAGGVCGFYQQPSCGMLALIHSEADKVFQPGVLPGNFPESGKYLLEHEALAAGVEIVYEAVPVEVMKDGNKITALRYLAEGRIHDAEAQVFIDSTADGRFSQLAGCRLTGGRDSDGLFQPFTNSMLKLDNHRVHVINFDAGRIDPYHEPEYSQTILQSLCVHLKDDYSIDPLPLVPAELPGTREGLHIDCGNNFTLPEFFRFREEPEPLFYVWSNLDTHARDLALESEILLEWLVGCSMWGPNLAIPVPKRTIFPKEFDNLIAAGRHLGVDHDLGHALRMNSLMGALGEAAGQIAALAVAQNVAPRIVPYADYAEKLYLDSGLLRENEAFFNLSDSEIKSGLDSDRCGHALWASRYRISADRLAQWMEEAPAASALRRHTAFALALQKDRRALPELQAMAAERDAYTPVHSRKYNHPRGYVAVFFLGSLRDAGSIKLLSEILNDDSADPVFEYQTHAWMALLKIGAANPAVREEISRILRQRIGRGWSVSARLKGTLGSMKRMDGVFRLAADGYFKEWGINGVEELLAGAELDAVEQGLARSMGSV